LQVW